MSMSHDDNSKGTRVIRKVDPTALPSRKVVHQKRKRKSGKGQFLIIKLLVILFILLPIGFFAVFTYLDNRSVPTSTDEIVSKVENQWRTITEMVKE